MYRAVTSAATQSRLLNKVPNASNTIALFFSAFELLMDFLSSQIGVRVQDDTSIASTWVG